MKKLTCLLTVVLILLTSCNKNQKQKGNDSPKQVTVGYLNMVSSLTHFVALKNGYYEEQNLEVIGNPIRTSNLIAQELVAGHIDVGIELAITPVIKQLELAPNSIKIFSTSNITTENGFDAIVVKPNSTIQSFQDLAGKKVGGFPGTTAMVSFLQLFSEQFPELEQPKFVQLAPNLHIQSLETGEIDALFAYEPVLSTGIVKYNFKKIFPSIYGTQFAPNPIGVGAVNQKWLNDKPEIAEAFFNAIDKAIEFIEDNPVKAKDILADATGIDPGVAQNMNTMPLSKSNEIDLENLNKYLILLNELNEVDITPAAVSICIKQ